MIDYQFFFERMIDYQFEPHTIIFSLKFNSVRGYLKTLISSAI